MQDSGAGDAAKQPQAGTASQQSWDCQSAKLGLPVSKAKEPGQLIAAQHTPHQSSHQLQQQSSPQAAFQSLTHNQKSSLSTLSSEPDLSDLQLQVLPNKSYALQTRTAALSPPQGVQSVSHQAGFASSSVSYQAPFVLQSTQSSSQRVSSTVHQVSGETVSQGSIQHRQSSTHQYTNAAGGQDQDFRAQQQQPYAVHAVQQSHVVEYTATHNGSGNSPDSQTIRTSSSHREFSFRSSGVQPSVPRSGSDQSATFQPCVLSNAHGIASSYHVVRNDVQIVYCKAN